MDFLWTLGHQKPRRSVPKSLKYPTLAFTKYSDTIPDAEKQPKAHHENAFRKIPGIGTYSLGARTTKSYEKGNSDLRRELSDIRRNEIPKNHNTPINEREFSWEIEQRRLILQDNEARKDARHLQRVSKSQEGVRNVAKSHDGVLNMEDIDTFDYHKLKKGSKNGKPPKRDNFLLPQLSEPQKAGSSSLVDVRNKSNAIDLKSNNALETPRELSSRKTESNQVEEINPDLVQLGWKDSREEIKKTTKLKKVRKRKDKIEDVEGHLRYQNGVLLPKKSFEGSNDAVTHQTNNDGEVNAEGNPEYCKCEQSSIDKLVCEECNLHGGKHKVWCSRWQRTVQGFVTCDICGKIRKRTSTLDSQRLPTLPTLPSLKRSRDYPDEEPGEETLLKLPNIRVTNKALRKVMLAARFLSGAQVEASNNFTPERYLARINERFDRGDFDWNHDVPNVNEVNTKLQLDDDKKEENPDIQKPYEVEMTVEEFPSYRKQQNGLTLYPNGVKEAYLKALQAAQIAKLDSFLSLQHRISKPFVFSYFKNVPRTEISSLAVCTPIREHKTIPLVLKGKRAEMKHIFGKINPDDYYPGQKKNPVRKKKIKVKTAYESQYLTTDRKPFVPLHRRSTNLPDHTHFSKITSLVMGSTAGE